MQNLQENIYRSLAFLRDTVTRRLDAFFSKDASKQFSYPEVDILRGDDYLSQFLVTHNVHIDEYALLLIALAPHVQPNFFENIIQQYLPQGGDFAEMGGVKGSNYRGMLPTGETAQFILAGYNFEQRLYIQRLLQLDSVLVKEQVLWLEEVKDGEPAMSGRLVLSAEWLSRLFTGEEWHPKFSADFPAKRITTGMQWDDLVLNAYTYNLIDDVRLWLQYGATLLKDTALGKKLKPGYRVLFHGPPGTGKTLTAALLGKQFNLDVFRVDLSMVVSKYIGETEKNLEKVFNKAVNKNWILFFDEADALFGKRTNVQNAHDRYANQEVSYLLQRIEDFPGVLILASNFKSNMDEAFLRRFQTVVHFAPPTVNERLQLWQKTMPAMLQPEDALNLYQLAEKYELTGAAILNIVHYATLQAVSKADTHIRKADVLEGVKRELRKEDKTMN